MFLPTSKTTTKPCWRIGHKKPYIASYGLLGLFVLTTVVEPALAHKVKVADDVGATLHIEPNDTPRAGEPSQTWFALTRKGGKVIPLAECNCQLAVYAEPHVSGETPLIQPKLTAIAAERYQDIPGAVINFPRPGAYQLELSGKPATGQDFRPFNLKFNVTVAVGSQNNQVTQPTQPAVSTENTSSSNFILPLVAIACVSLGAIAFFVWRKSHR